MSTQLWQALWILTYVPILLLESYKQYPDKHETQILIWKSNFQVQEYTDWTLFHIEGHTYFLTHFKLSSPYWHSILSSTELGMSLYR